MAKKITLESLSAQIDARMTAMGSQIDARMTVMGSQIDARMTAMGSQITSLATQMENGFGAVASDIADIRHEMATKDQVLQLHTQVNSIEATIRDMNHTKIEDRVITLEEKVFGRARA